LLQKFTDVSTKYTVFFFSVEVASASCFAIYSTLKWKQYNRFDGIYCILLQGWSSQCFLLFYLFNTEMETVQSFETSTNNSTTWCAIPEDSNILQVYCFLQYNVMQSVESQPTFRRNISPPVSRSKNKPRKEIARNWVASRAQIPTCIRTGSSETSIDFPQTTCRYILILESSVLGYSFEKLKHLKRTVPPH
jgi:hypothetical protein